MERVSCVVKRGVQGVECMDRFDFKFLRPKGVGKKQTTEKLMCVTSGAPA